jgi:hypothetical protein
MGSQQITATAIAWPERAELLYYNDRKYHCYLNVAIKPSGGFR